MLPADLRELLAIDLPPLARQLNATLLASLEANAEAWLQRRRWQPGQDAPADTLLEFCRDELRRLQQARDALQTAWLRFAEQYRHAIDDVERGKQILTFAAVMDDDRDRLADDRRALARWLDREAIHERYLRRLHAGERMIVFVLERLAGLAGQRMREDDPLACWQRLQLEPLLLPVLSSEGDPRVRIAGFACMARVLCQHPDAGQAISPATTQYVFRFALDARQPAHLQGEAIALVATLAPQRLAGLVGERLADPAGSDLFLRRRIVAVLAAHSAREQAGGADLQGLLAGLATDASDGVRQAVATALPRMHASLVHRLAPLLVGDRARAVSGALAVALPALAARPDTHALVPVLLRQLLAGDNDPFVLRATMHVLPELLDRPAANALAVEVDTLLTALHTGHAVTAVRRQAAQARERLWALTASEPLRHTVAGLARLPPGVRQSLPVDGDDPLLARLLAVQAQQDFGYDLGQKRVRREFRRVFRTWRFLHEMVTPASGKRQNASHVGGRAWDEITCVPAQGIAEMSATRVPGEPLQITDEGGWRPWLPLVDQAISCLDQGWPTQALRIVTAEGTTLLTPPVGLLARLRARWALTRRFAYYAQLRNWTPESPQAPDAWLQALVALGFRVSLETHPDRRQQPYPRDPRVMRFFPAFVPAFVLPAGLVDQWRGIQDYFYSVYQNTLSQLLVFCAGIAAVFFGNHLWRNFRVRRARGHIPLVIGGWGTRGKSGTERLKAALFSALGSNVVAKTTGCEAMFLYGGANRPLREMFLYRPYDKATIWEQAETTVLAAELDADVLLWECMALNPRYVEILQRQWMHDDVSTLTNCFPDHEDIQGPAGVDIPEVMTRFVPRASVLLTSEENMLPYLAHAAHAEETRLVSTGWLQAGLLATDVLARFPYHEHPYNLALVLALATELGVDHDFALAEMAARVVPDIGVLKVFPRSRVDGRTLEFINGMSANERLSTLENWRRTGMDRHALADEPDLWLATLVNNRDDRVARSQVFADVIVGDLNADCHLLIGSNLGGLRAYIDAALDGQLARLDEAAGHDDVARLADTLATRFRVPRSEDIACARLRAMLAGCGITTAPHAGSEALLAVLATHELADERWRAQILAQWQRDRDDLAAWDALAMTLADTALPAARLREALREAARAWLARRIICLDDRHADGNRVVATLAAQVPPGLTCRAMGVQNIKGTGLDFVYRWQAWERVARLCDELLHAPPAVAAAAAHALAATVDFGLLDEQAVLAALAAASARPDLHTSTVQNDLANARAALERQLAAWRAPAHRQQGSAAWLALVDLAEDFLDAGSAVRRRRMASQIYRDLSAARISHERAALVLMELNREQGGGWLRRRLGLA